MKSLKFATETEVRPNHPEDFGRELRLLAIRVLELGLPPERAINALSEETGLDTVHLNAWCRGDTLGNKSRKMTPVDFQLIVKYLWGKSRGLNTPEQVQALALAAGEEIADTLDSKWFEDLRLPKPPIVNVDTLTEVAEFRALIVPRRSLVSEIAREVLQSRAKGLPLVLLGPRLIGLSTLAEAVRSNRWGGAEALLTEFQQRVWVVSLSRLQDNAAALVNENARLILASLYRDLANDDPKYKWRIPDLQKALEILLLKPALIIIEDVQDVIEVQPLLDLLLRLKVKHQVVITTHDLNLARRLSARVLDVKGLTLDEAQMLLDRYSQLRSYVPTPEDRQAVKQFWQMSEGNPSGLAHAIQMALDIGWPRLLQSLANDTAPIPAGYLRAVYLSSNLSYEALDQDLQRQARALGIMNVQVWDRVSLAALWNIDLGQAADAIVRLQREARLLRPVATADKEQWAVDPLGWRVMHDYLTKEIQEYEFAKHWLDRLTHLPENVKTYRLFRQSVRAYTLPEALASDRQSTIPFKLKVVARALIAAARPFRISNWEVFKAYAQRFSSQELAFAYRLYREESWTNLRIALFVFLGGGPVALLSLHLDTTTLWLIWIGVTIGLIVDGFVRSVLRCEAAWQRLWAQGLSRTNGEAEN